MLGSCSKADEWESKHVGGGCRCTLPGGHLWEDCPWAGTFWVRGEGCTSACFGVGPKLESGSKFRNACHYSARGHLRPVITATTVWIFGLLVQVEIWLLAVVCLSVSSVCQPFSFRYESSVRFIVQQTLLRKRHFKSFTYSKYVLMGLER